MLQGVSPTLSLELCAAAGFMAAGDPACTSSAEWQALHWQWQAWLTRLAEGQPCLVLCGLVRWGLT